MRINATTHLGGGKLLDRHSDCTLRIQTPRTGQIVDVTPLPEDREEAAAIWGGRGVEYFHVTREDGTIDRIFAGQHANSLYEHYEQ